MESFSVSSAQNIEALSALLSNQQDDEDEELDVRWTKALNLYFCSRSLTEVFYPVIIILQFNCDRMYQPLLGWVLETSVLSLKKRKKVMPSFFYLWDLTCFSTYHGTLKDQMEFEFVSTLTFSVQCLFEEEQQGYLEWGRSDRRLPIRWSLWPPSTAWVRRHFESVSLFSLYLVLSLQFLYQFSNISC